MKNLQKKSKSFFILGQEDLNSKLQKDYKIDNYINIIPQDYKIRIKQTINKE